MATYSFKQYGTFSREYEIVANSEEDARKMFRAMSESEREDYLVFDDYYIEDFDIDCIDVEK